MESDERRHNDNDDEDEDHKGPTSNAGDIMRRRPTEGQHETHKSSISASSPSCSVIQKISREDVFFIATWGILGAIVRIYIGRLFGQDCETDAGDFWQASNLCITASGVTGRRGGSLFIDLPANVLGSFLMGILSASDEHPIPWFPRDHHLQRHASWHKGLTTGFCGCLTTFASWNTQMVVMLDGTEAEDGPQIAAALGGYAIGMLTAIAAYLWGGVVARMWHNAGNGEVGEASTFDEDDEEQPTEDDQNKGHVQVLSGKEAVSSPEQILCPSDGERSSQIEGASTPSQRDLAGSPIISDNDDLSQDETQPSIMHMGGSILSFATLLLVVALMLVFGYIDLTSDYIFYRRMWMTCLCTPVGAVLRSQLKQWLPTSKSIQWGTWTANILGAILSILLHAIMVRFLADDQVDSYFGTFLWALKVGFAGSLSTVSTFVKELVGLERLLDRHLYAIVTLLVAMGLCLAIYTPIVRY